SLSDRCIPFAGCLGQPPVDDQSLSVLAEYDVARLDVAMKYSPRMGVIDRIANVQEPPQQFTKLQIARSFRVVHAGSTGSDCRIAVRRFHGARIRKTVEALNRLLQRSTADESHGVVRTPVRVRAHPVDRNDSWMLEPPGDFGLEQKSGSTGFIV